MSRASERPSMSRSTLLSWVPSKIVSWRPEQRQSYGEVEAWGLTWLRCDMQGHKQ